MQPKRIKLVLTAIVVLLLRWAGSSHAAESAPYDHKNALREVLDGPYQLPAHSPPESIDRLFWKARRFSYSEEKAGDDWQFPQETEKKQAGDCEDKALWLYAHLRAAGYKDLKLIVGKYRSLDTNYHVWLMRVDEDGNAFILDPTIQNRVWLLSAFQPGFYQPLFYLV